MLEVYQTEVPGHIGRKYGLYPVRSASPNLAFLPIRSQLTACHDSAWIWTAEGVPIAIGMSAEGKMRPDKRQGSLDWFTQPMLSRGNRMVEQGQRLHRSRDSRFLFGVAGGLAEYLDTDPVLVRLGWILLTMATLGIAMLFYLGLAIITPDDRRRVSGAMPVNDASGESSDSAVEGDPDEGPPKSPLLRYVLGVGLIIVGMLILLQQLDVFDSIRWDIVWPVAIILLGMTILLPSIVRYRR